jgi:hypothetical protein
MYHRKLPVWVYCLHSFGGIVVVKSTVKLKEILENKGFPAIYLSPSDDLKVDFESLSAVFLQKPYGDFHKLDKSEFQFAAIAD